MLDLYKYSKKNKFYSYLIKNFLGVKTESLEKSFFHSSSIKLDVQKDFFYDYKKKKSNY